VTDRNFKTELESTVADPAAARLVPSTSAPPPALADRYQVTARLGRGATGDVFAAKDRTFDREVAVNQQKLYDEQRKAEESRAAFVKAQEDAEQQRNLAKATFAVQVQEQQAKARAAEAKGESDYQIITGEGRAKAYRAMVDALGREQVAQLEMLKLVAEGKVQITPQVMVLGNGGTMDALAGTLLRQAIPAKPEK